MGQLIPNAITVWTVALDQPAERARELARCLSDEERQRAARFQQPLDQTRFIVRRAALRLLLADYLGQPPREIAFQRSAYGKPFIMGNPHRLEFNVSKSHGLALIAVTPTRPVGVDVELIRPLAEIDELAARIFSDSERQDWHSFPADDRIPAFYAAWTRKEAFVKAIGRGLLIPLDQVAAASMPGWTVRTLTIAGDCAGAVAAEGNNWAVEQRAWNL